MVPLVKMGITFVMAPVIVHALGNYDYGIWEIVFSIVGYMGMLDLGLAPAIVRYVSRQHALEDKIELQRIYSTAMAFFFPMGLLMALILITAAFCPHVFIHNAKDGFSQRYSLFLIIVSSQVFVSFIGIVLDSFLEGFQRYRLRNNATIIASICGAIILYPLLKAGYGLLVLAAGNAIGFTLKNAFYLYILSRRDDEGFHFRIGDISRQTFKELFTFGLKSFIYATSFSIGHLTDKLIVGAFIGPVAVAFYTIPVNLLSQARNLIWSITRVFMPVFSELDAHSEKGRSRDLLFTSSRYALGVILPLLGGICILGPAFLRYWIGEQYALQGRWIIYIMASAYFFQWLCPFRNRFLTGIGRLNIQARFGIIGVIINLLTSIVLVLYWGKEGVALGTLIPAILIEPYLLLHTCQVAGGKLKQYIISVYLPLFLPFAFFLLFLFWMVSIFPPQNLLSVIVLAFIGVGAYLPFFFLLGMTRLERNEVIVRVRNLLIMFR